MPRARTTNGLIGSDDALYPLDAPACLIILLSTSDHFMIMFGRPTDQLHRVPTDDRPESLLPKGVVEPDADAVTVQFHVHRVEYLGAERHLAM